MKRIVFIAAGLLAAALLSSCPGRAITVLSYNVGNLFDGVDDGTEYPEYDPGRGAWSDSLFRLKLGRVALAVSRSTPGGPDVVILQEIENPRVLERLRVDGVGGLGYAHAACYPASRGAATIGVLSRFPLRRVAVYELEPGEKREPLRPVLEAAVEADGKVVRLFCVHLKSKAGGADRETEKARLEAAGIIARRTREIAAAEPETAVIVAGDFNERADEYEKTGRAYQTALLRLADAVPESWDEASLRLCARPDESGVRGGRVVFFEPWLSYSGAPAGSYYYGRHWEDIDHILFLPGGSGIEFASFRVVCEPDMLHPRTGRPLSWDKKKPKEGFSDHLPVLLTLQN